MTENEIATRILDGAFEVHRELGPGLLESVYEIALAHVLAESGLKVRRQVSIPVNFRRITFEEGFRADLLVEEKVIVELKSVRTLEPVFQKQLQTYLRLADKRLGLLINFNEAVLRTGIKRVVNGLEE